MNTNTNTLSPIALAIVDGYWTLCSGGEAVQAVIEDFLSRTPESGMLPWSHDGESIVTPEEFLTAIVEVLEFFRVKGEVV